MGFFFRGVLGGRGIGRDIGGGVCGVFFLGGFGGKGNRKRYWGGGGLWGYWGRFKREEGCLWAFWEGRGLREISVEILLGGGGEGGEEGVGDKKGLVGILGGGGRRVFVRVFEVKRGFYGILGGEG